MVTSIISTAVSGLRAAETRLANSANNVANLQSENFTPQRVLQTSTEPGTRADLIDVDPARIATAEGDTPNVNLEGEIVDQQIATYNFKANLQVLKAADEMTEDLLNIRA
jgi:flagellar basal-body rod protein FlgC